MPEQSITSAWASTKPGTTKYHFYDATGNSLCAYQRGEGTLWRYGGHFEVPEEACTSCALHYRKGHHLTSATPDRILEPGTRVRVMKGKLTGAYGRIQRWDAEGQLYFVDFGASVGGVHKAKYVPLFAKEIEEAPL